jgi:hypothetical protein
MALSYNTRKALEYSALFVADSMRRADTLDERDASLRYLVKLIRNLDEAGLESKDFKHLFPALEDVYLKVWADVKSAVAIKGIPNGNPHS